MSIKLKYREVATERAKRLKQQNNLCALCGEPIVDDAVLDHDHKTGHIRTVLHRGCNALLGKIENNLARNKITPSRLEAICESLFEYVTREYPPVLHPTHRTGPRKRRKSVRKNKK